MATIKLQPSGAVVLKDGKVSCSCCGPEIPCCMYAGNLAGREIPFEDLPSPIYVDGIAFAKQIGEVPGDLPYYINGENQIQSGWVLIGPMTDYISFSSTCLFGEYISIDDPVLPPILVEDQFANSYTVTGPINGTVTRNIESGKDCIWSGEGLTLRFFVYEWKVNGKNKSGLQNTPVGSYEGGYTVS